MKKTTITKLAHGATHTLAPPVVQISMPAMPFDLPSATTDETAPRSAPIRGEYDWRKDRTLRHAARMK